MRYVYSIVRFVPDSARGEFINFGVIAGSDDTGEWDLRSVSNNRRARYLDDASVFGRVVALVEDIAAAIDRATQAGEALLPDGTMPSEVWLSQLASEYNNLLQFSRPTPIFAETFEEVFDFAFREMIVDPGTVHRPYKKRDVAVARARAAYADFGIKRNIDFIERVPVQTARYKDRFDFVVANGQAVQLAQAWSFQIPNKEDLIRDMKAWAWTVHDIRQEGGAVNTDVRRVEVPSSVDVAAIYIPPLDETGAEAVKVATALCDDAHIRFVPLADVVPGVVAVAREYLAAAH